MQVVLAAVHPNRPITLVEVGEALNHGTKVWLALAARDTIIRILIIIM